MTGKGKRFEDEMLIGLGWEVVGNEEGEVWMLDRKSGSP